MLFGESSSHTGDIDHALQWPHLYWCLEIMAKLSIPIRVYWPHLASTDIWMQWCSPIEMECFCEHRHSSFVLHRQPLTYSSRHQNASAVLPSCNSIIPWSCAGNSNRRVEKNSIPVEIPLRTNQQLARCRLFSLFLSIMKPLHASTMNLKNT